MWPLSWLLPSLDIKHLKFILQNLTQGGHLIFFCSDFSLNQTAQVIRAIWRHGSFKQREQRYHSLIFLPSWKHLSDLLCSFHWVGWHKESTLLWSWLAVSKDDPLMNHLSLSSCGESPSTEFQLSLWLPVNKGRSDTWGHSKVRKSLAAVVIVKSSTCSGKKQVLVEVNDSHMGFFTMQGRYTGQKSQPTAQEHRERKMPNHPPTLPSQELELWALKPSDVTSLCHLLTSTPWENPKSRNWELDSSNPRTVEDHNKSLF